MQIRPLRAGEAGAVVALWNRAAPTDPTSLPRFRDQVLLDANFDPDGLRLAWDGDDLVGAAYAVRRRTAMVGADLEPDRGWLPWFFVAPEARRRGVGRAVVTSALDHLRDHGAREAWFSSYTPNYVLPGLDREAYPAAGPLLADLGFRTADTVAAMDRTLVGYAPPAGFDARVADLTAAGWSFDTPTVDELPALIRLAGEHFNPDWARAIREALLAGLPPERIVRARDPEGTLIGWAMHDAYPDGPERFGPFGVLESRRGLGLGGVLLHLTLTRMKAAGAHGAWFLWTGEDSPAGHLYTRAGFTVTRRFDILHVSL